MSKRDQMNTNYSFRRIKSRKRTGEVIDPNSAHGIKGALRGQDHCWEAKWILYISFHCGLTWRSVLDSFGEGGCSSESMSDTELARDVVETLTMQTPTGDGQCSPKRFKRSQGWNSWRANGNVWTLSLKLFWYVRTAPMVNVVPVFKTGSRENGGNYKPVAWDLYPPS